MCMHCHVKSIGPDYYLPAEGTAPPRAVTPFRIRAPCPALPKNRTRYSFQLPESKSEADTHLGAPTLFRGEVA